MNTQRDHPAVSKIITDDLIDIFGQNEHEILNFIGITNEIDEYELRFTNSSEILNWDHGAEENEPEAEEEDLGDFKFYESDKELALSQILAAEAEIAADINKYLKALKSIESLEFEQISREEIFERLKCKCFEWNQIKKKETIRDVIKQICKSKTCKKEAQRREQEEKQKKKSRHRKKKKKKFRVCTGPIQKRTLRRKKKRTFTKKEVQAYTSLRDKISRDTFKLQIKKFADFSLSKSRLDDSSSSEESLVTTPKHLLRAKDSMILRKKVDVVSIQDSDSMISEESMSTMSENLQHLESLDKLGKRKIHPKMFNMYLNEFNTIKNFAFVFVDNILQEAETKANVSIMNPLDFDIKDYICPEYVCGEEEIKPPSIVEKTISLYSEVYGYDLSPHEGKNMVRDIIKYWKVRKTWKYCINFLGQQKDSCNDFYNYEVKWSEPTFSYPVPQVTASVFFNIELSRVKPTLFPPKVTFVFECERYKFTSFDDIAHEKFLDEIIICKTAFFKSMRF